MPTVPGLIPEQKASVGGTPEVSVSAPVEAFGGAVGHAISGLGTAVDKAGDEIWKTAVKFQEIQNKTEADRAETAYMEKAGLLHAEFSALQGDNATQSFPKYIQDLKQAREDIGRGLSNNAVRQSYDSATQSTMGRTIFNGAGHAATQAKASQIDAVGQKLSVTMSRAATADNDDDFRIEQRKSLELGRQDNALRGRASAPEAEFNINSSLYANRAQHVAKTDPYRAEEMMNAWRKDMTAQDFKTTNDIVLSTKRSVGAANIARDVWTKNTDGGEAKVALGDMEAQARKQAEAQFPGDELAASHAENAVSTLWNRRKQAQTSDRYEAKNDIYSIMLKGGVNNLQELLATPEGNAAYFKLDEVGRKGVEKEITSYIKAKNQIIGDTNYNRLWRMAKSDDPAAVSEFLNTPLADQPVTQSQLEKLSTVRKQLTKDPKADPRITRAMGSIRAARGEQLQALRIYKRSDNPDEYDKFTGALWDAIESFSDINKKPPTDKQITDEIAPTLLQAHSVPRLFGLYTGSEQNYVVPSEFSEGMKAKSVEAGRTIDDRDIRRAYIQTLMKKYQPPKASDGGK